MATIADLTAKLTLDTAAFKKELEGAGASTTSFVSRLKTGMLGAAAIVSGALVGAFYTLGHVLTAQTEKVSELVHMSERLSIGVVPLQELSYAAKLSGVDIGDLNTALRFMEKNLGNASAGIGKAGTYLDVLGLSAQKLVGMNVDQQFLAIADALKHVDNADQQNAISVALFGKGANKVLGLLRSDIRETIGEFDSLGVALTSDQAVAIEKYGEEVKKLDAVWEGFKNQLSAALAGPLTEFVQNLELQIKSMGGLSAIAQKVLPVIMTMFKELSFFVKLAYDAFELLRKSIDYVVLGLAKLSELRAKSSASSNDVFGDPSKQKAVNDQYQQSIQYTKAVKEQIAGAAQAQKALNATTGVETGSGISSTPVSSTAMINNKMTELGIQKQVTAENTAQLNILKEAVRAQQQKNNKVAEEDAKLQQYVNHKGGENERFLTSLGYAKQMAHEFASMEKKGLFDNLDEKKVERVRSSVEKLQEYYDKLQEDGGVDKKLAANTLNDFQKGFDNLNNPKNQFGAGNTARDNKVALDVKISAEEGFKASVANSSENKAVINSLISNRIAAASSGSR